MSEADLEYKSFKVAVYPWLRNVDLFIDAGRYLDVKAQSLRFQMSRKQPSS